MTRLIPKTIVTALQYTGQSLEQLRNELERLGICDKYFIRQKDDKIELVEPYHSSIPIDPSDWIILEKYENEMGYLDVMADDALGKYYRIEND
jgi:hypothetical protein